MNIAIIGAHITGKTTLFEGVKKALPSDHDIKFFDEEAQKEIANADSFFSYMNLQEQILIKQVETLKWLEKYEANGMSDRSIIDNLTYMIVGRESHYTYAFPGDINANIEKLKELSPIVSKAIKLFHDYELLFYIPIEFKVGEPTREQITYQWTVNDVIKHLLKVHGIKHYTIMGSETERRDLVLAMIRQYKEGI